MGMIIVMVEIYLLIAGQIYPEVRRMSVDLLVVMIQAIIYINGNCLIHGLVHEESDKLLSVMHTIDISKVSEQEFRETLIFMTIRREIPFGFTIGGFMPMRKTTLLSGYFII